jgi:type IV secretion system protein TrbB
VTNLVNIKAAQDRGARLDQKLRRELGEGVLQLLADDRTEDVCLNPDSTLWVKRMNQPFEQFGEMSPSQAQTTLGTIAAMKGTVINHERPILETELPLDGSRFEGLVSPVVRSPVFAVRLRPRRVFRLEEYEASEILTAKDDPRNRLRQRARFLDSIRGRNLSHGEIVRAAITEKRNILVVGINRFREDHICQRDSGCHGADCAA